MRWQVFGVGAAVILSALGLGLIGWKADPAVASPLLKASFFIALFIFVWGINALIVFSIKNRFFKPRYISETMPDSVFNTSVLVGLFCSILITAAVLIRKFL